MGCSLEEGLRSHIDTKTCRRKASFACHQNRELRIERNADSASLPVTEADVFLARFLKTRAPRSAECYSLEKRNCWEDIPRKLHELSSNIQIRYERTFNMHEVMYEVPVAKHLFSTKVDGNENDGTKAVPIANQVYTKSDHDGRLREFGPLYLPVPSFDGPFHDPYCLPMKCSIFTLDNKTASNFSLLHTCPNVASQPSRTIGSESPAAWSGKPGVIIDLFRVQRIDYVGVASELPHAMLIPAPVKIRGSDLCSAPAAWVVERPAALAWITSYDLFCRARAVGPWIRLGRFEGNQDAASEAVARLGRLRPGGGDRAGRARRAGIVLARFLKLVPTGWHNRPLFRVAVYGWRGPFDDMDGEGAADAAASGPGVVRYVVRLPMPAPSLPEPSDEPRGHWPVAREGPRAWCVQCGKVCAALPAWRCYCGHARGAHRAVPDATTVEAAPRPRPRRRGHDGCARRAIAAAAASAVPAVRQAGRPGRRRSEAWGRGTPGGSGAAWWRIEQDEEAWGFVDGGGDYGEEDGLEQEWEQGEEERGTEGEEGDSEELEEGGGHSLGNARRSHRGGARGLSGRVRGVVVVTGQPLLGPTWQQGLRGQGPPAESALTPPCLALGPARSPPSPPPLSLPTPAPFPSHGNDRAAGKGWNVCDEEWEWVQSP